MGARICVVGSANLDTVYTVDALPSPGETVLAASARSAPGGKGANQAVAAARAGARVRFVGAVGDDSAAQRLREHLTANQVATDALRALPGPSGTAVILVDAAGQNTIVVAPGVNAHLALDAVAHTAITDCDVLMVQLEIPVPTAVAAARAARAAGATVMVNASPAGAELAELSALTDVVVVNEAEAAHWRWPVPHRIITLGALGARYLGDGEDVTVAAPTVRAVDTAGAGDVFAGVLAASWHCGPRTALHRACAAGALATMVSGPGDCAPSAEDIDQAIDQAWG